MAISQAEWDTFSGDRINYIYLRSDFKSITKYTLLEEGGSGRPHCSFENRRCSIDILYIILEEIVWQFRSSLNFSKIF